MENGCRRRGENRLPVVVGEGGWVRFEISLPEEGGGKVNHYLSNKNEAYYAVIFCSIFSRGFSPPASRMMGGNRATHML